MPRKLKVAAQNFRRKKFNHGWARMEKDFVRRFFPRNLFCENQRNLRMFLSVSICVHPWLKILAFNFFNKLKLELQRFGNILANSLSPGKNQSAGRGNDFISCSQFAI
jgi:hypothetical protein